MAHSTKKGHGNAWRPKETDEQYDKIETPDGTKYILYVPNFNQRDAYQKSSKKYKDVFDQIKTKVKDDPAIEKNGDGLPILHPVAWAALLSSTLKELNITWGVNDKIWIYNKLHDRDREHIAMYVAITPKITQRNAKRTVRKASSRKVSPATKAHYNTVVLRDEDIVFGTEPLGTITQQFFVKTAFNGNKYYYLNKKDADEGNMNYDHVEEYVSEDEKSISSADEDEDEEDEKASKGGKRTRKHLIRKSTTTRRKMTTIRR